MANIPIDDLQIDIVVNASKAESALNSLASSLRGLRQSSSGIKDVAHNIESVGRASASSSTTLRATAEEIKKTGKSSNGAKDHVKALSKEMSGLSSKAKTSSSAFGTLFSSLKRIAMYRALRSAIKGITQALSEGIQNLVKWDATFGNNSSGALATMTELKSLALQVKNTLGAMAMPIIQLFVPALRVAAQILMGIANIINQLVRSLQGYSTYMKAVYVETDYLGDSLGNAAGKAKELKRVLFGFDELNVLPSPDKGGSSGGTGILGGYNEMFRETETWLSKINEEVGRFDIKSKLEEVMLKVAYAARDLFTWIGELFKPVYVWINDNIFKPIGDFIGGIPKKISDAANKAWGYIHAYLVNPVSGFVGAIKDSLKLIVDRLSHPLDIQGWKNLPNEIDEVWSNFFNDVDKEIKDLNKTEIKPKVKTDASPITSLPTKAKETQKTLNNTPIKFKTKVDPITGEQITKVEKNAQNVANKSGVVGYLSKLNSITNVDNIKALAQKNATKQGSVDFTSKLSKITNLSNIKASAQTSADKQSPIGLKSALKSVPNLTAIRDGAQTSVNKFAPIAFSSTVITKGLGAVLANAWEILQRTLNNNPLSYATTVGTVGVNTNVMQVRKQNIAQAYASGGVPDVGTLFYAGESGAEVVANMGGRTGVMNVGQMEQAVANGNTEVVNAIYAMANMISRELRNKDMNAYISQDAIGQAAARYQVNQARRGVAY